jgi:ABC-2 type transport system permease protein
MRRFLATCRKDLLILGRDRAALLVLFLMPAVLVLVVSLVQNNILKTLGADPLRVLLVDQDHGSLGQAVRARLPRGGALQLIDSLPAGPLSEEAARGLVAAGDYQFGVLIPAGSSGRVQERAAQLAARALQTGAEQETGPVPAPPAVVVFFDPAVQGAVRATVAVSLRQVLSSVEMEEKGRALGRLLERLLSAGTQPFPWARPAPRSEALARVLGGEMLLPLREEAAATGPVLPNAVQQNVPAWALFGMFFIVVPLSGALLREKQEGTLVRLRTLPVSPAVILLGKIASFTAVCLVQFTLMLAVGRYLLPLFGTPELDPGQGLVPAYVLALAAALAATGYGLLVGSAARSQEQASMFGAVSVVVAAALGGVMVPVYVMPRAMQTLSLASPLAWGINGFLEIFVRGGGMGRIWPDILLLLGFFAACVALSLWLSGRRRAGR